MLAEVQGELVFERVCNAKTNREATMLREDFIAILGPQRLSEYGRLHAPQRLKRVAKLIARPRARHKTLRRGTKSPTAPLSPELTRRSPLPSVREIDEALERKYGASRYREL